MKTAAEIANASVISGKANRDAWYTSMAESVPGMTNVLQAIDSYEVAHSPDRDKKSPAALERRQQQHSHHEMKMEKKDHTAAASAPSQNTKTSWLDERAGSRNYRPT